MKLLRYLFQSALSGVSRVSLKISWWKIVTALLSVLGLVSGCFYLIIKWNEHKREEIVKNIPAVYIPPIKTIFFGSDENFLPQLSTRSDKAAFSLGGSMYKSKGVGLLQIQCTKKESKIIASAFTDEDQGPLKQTYGLVLVNDRPIVGTISISSKIIILSAKLENMELLSDIMENIEQHGHLIFSFLNARDENSPPPTNKISFFTTKTDVQALTIEKIDALKMACARIMN